MGETKQDTKQAPAITAADVPKHVADAIVRERVRAATVPNIGKAAEIADAYYNEVGATTREEADQALCDALGVNRDETFVIETATA